MTLQAHAPSYYAATAHAYAPYHAAVGGLRCDVCVVGGGFTGLSAALHLAERGYDVVLLEAAQTGWGASGRNGGQLIPGLRKGAAELVKMLGAARARAAFDLALSAIDLVRDRISRHAIDCDYKPSGHFLAAAKQRDMAWIAAEVDTLHQLMGCRDATVVPRADVHQFVDQPNYFGGLFDARGGHLHPLNYALGLARAASAAGVRIFENSRVVKISNGAKPSVKTANSDIRADFIVMDCDAYLDGLDAELGKRVMPVGNYIVATQPLPSQLAATLLPRDTPVSDTKFVLDYYRLSADKRLLFSGGEKYSATPPRDIAAFVTPYLHRTFPQLASVPIDYAWGGMVSVTTTRLPDIGRRGAVFHAQGYSGQGVALTTLAGAVLAEAIAGTAERFDVLDALRPPAFPGGTLLRTPGYVLGMLYFALRDRL